tara:strand:+ start:1952 stop:2725 length:774 start_codon:yes stop_codon:yes gene_type:complete
MLEAEKIKENWERYRELVNTLFPTRKDSLNKMYDEFEERMVFMPASGMAHFHNAFAGGYVDHVLRVMDCAEALHFTWSSMGSDMSGYTKEEMLFAAMHHDLGKVGFPGDGNEVYQIETSDWHRKNQNKMYKHNENIPFAMVPDLSLWLLQTYDVKTSWNEYQAIKIHDGMYDDANKPYFISRSAQAKFKTNLPILLHHADHMASTIEYERWRNIKNNTPKPVAEKSKATKAASLKNLAEGNPAMGESIVDIFKGFGE